MNRSDEVETNDLPASGPSDEILSQRLRELLEDVLEGRAPNAGHFCGNCYHPVAGEEEICRHCGISSSEVGTVEAVPLEVIEMHRQRRSKEGLVVRTFAWVGLTIGVTVALLPFVFGDVTVLTAVAFFGLLLVFYIGSANLANSVGDALGYRWGRSQFEKRWRDFIAERDSA
ncbi:MAG: hypothetical protein IH957_12535 [Chloroflexi bacterium]|nr:hypothetical protein [Chloroflexota bacterium]